MKQIIIEPCLINYGDDRGGIDHAVGETVDVPKQTAAFLAQSGRTLYIDRKDDPSKNSQHTATKEMLRAAGDLAASRKKEAAAPAA